MKTPFTPPHSHILGIPWGPLHNLQWKCLAISADMDPDPKEPLLAQLSVVPWTSSRPKTPNCRAFQLKLPPPPITDCESKIFTSSYFGCWGLLVAAQRAPRPGILAAAAEGPLLCCRPHALRVSLCEDMMAVWSCPAGGLAVSRDVRTASWAELCRIKAGYMRQ